MSSVTEATGMSPFRIVVRDDELAELRRRIAAVRRPSRELVEDRSQGVQLATVQELARYWQTDYDWRAGEARLNELPQFTTDIDGVPIHFIQVWSPHPNALPLVITHGWPGSVLELLGLVGPLTDPPAHGGQPRTRSTWCCRRCRATGSPGSRSSSAGTPDGSVGPGPS